MNHVEDIGLNYESPGNPKAFKEGITQIGPVSYIDQCNYIIEAEEERARRDQTTTGSNPGTDGVSHIGGVELESNGSSEKYLRW